MADFLLELFCEEIPARMQRRAADDLRDLVLGALKDKGLTFSGTEAHSTPRRLCLHVEGLPLDQPAVTEERKGPRADAPEKAIEGFLRATGLTLDQCERRDTPKGPVLFAVIERPGRPTDTVLTEVITDVLSRMPWPKTMRWGDSSFRWVRPLHHILAVFDDRPLMGVFEPEPHIRFSFSAMAHGHRFLSPDAFPVRSFDSYRSGLLERHVILCREERKRTITEGLEAHAERRGLRLRDDPGLLEEVAGLVEWPVPLIGRIDDDFMSVPPEALTTAMRTHQRYFAFETDSGELAPMFGVVANTKARHDGQEVVAGNERVLRARLSDARFFWDQDRRTRLADRVPSLSAIVFHARLGTVAERAERLSALSGDIAAAIGADAEAARRAGYLAKADLTTDMVGEFPELQGIMGGHYARHDGEPEPVARAVSSHYAPQGPSDRCPADLVAVSVALADKIDALVGFFGIGEKPTGSRDPFALRRAGLGVIRLVVENGLRLSLVPVFTAAAGRYGNRLDVATETLVDDVMAFLADRLTVSLRGSGTRHDLINAVFATGHQDDLVRLLARVEALAKFLSSDDGINLLTAYRRAGNIVRIEAKKDGQGPSGPVEAGLLVETAEQGLNAALTGAEADLDRHLSGEDFGGAMAALAELRGPVDALFEDVTVNASDPNLRLNRLRLLSGIVSVMNAVADFSQIEG